MSKRIDTGGPSLPPRRRYQPAAPRRADAARERIRDRIVIAVGSLLVAFGLFTGFVAFAMIRAHSLNPFTSVTNFIVPAPESVFGKQRIYVLLLGLDYDYTADDQPTSRDSRTDKVEAFALDFPSKVVKSVGVPRDMDAIVEGHEDKLNDAYHYGGWKNTDKIVGPWLGLSPNERGTYFDRYLTLRINASKDLIDAVGGLDVPVAETINYDDNWGHLHIHFTPGLTHMSGEQAVSYARFRHDACSDPCRIKRQQQIEHLVIEKLKKDRFNDLAHIASLIDVVRRDVDTNLSVDEMKSLGWAFRDVNLADLRSTVVPYVSDKVLRCCGDVVIPDTDALQKIAADFTGSYVGTPSADLLATVKPAEVSIAVLNGSGIAGLGGKMAEFLRAAGYDVQHVGNAESFDHGTTEIRTRSKIPFAGERARSDLKLPDAAIVTTVDPTATTDLVIVAGRDFASAVAAAPSPSPVP